MFSKIVLSLGIESYQTAILYHYIYFTYFQQPIRYDGYKLSQFMIPWIWGWRPPHLSIWIGNGIFVQLSQDSKKHLAFDRVAVVHLDSITNCGNKLLLLHQKSQWFICVQKSLNFGKIPKGILDELYFCTTKRHLQKKNDLGGFQTLFWGVLDLKRHLVFEVRNFKQNSTKKTPEKPRRPQRTPHAWDASGYWSSWPLDLGSNRGGHGWDQLDSRKPNVHWQRI